LAALWKRGVAGSKSPAIDCGAGEKKTVKLLTQDGRLVEADLSRTRVVKKVTDGELRNWIKRQKP